MAKMVTNTTTPITLPTMAEVCVGVAELRMGGSNVMLGSSGVLLGICSGSHSLEGLRERREEIDNMYVQLGQIRSMHRFGPLSLDSTLQHIRGIASSERPRPVVHHRTLDYWVGGAIQLHMN